MPYQETKQVSGWMLKAIIMAIIAIAAFTLGPLVFGNVDVQVAYSDHASQHCEADDIRNSTKVLGVFLNNSGCRYNVLKELPDGRVGDQVVQPCKRFGFKMVLEVTAYVIGGGTLDEAISVMKAKGCTQVWP